MTFDELYNDYADVIHRIASSYAPPGAERDDLEQEIALALLGALDRFRADASLKTYIYRIANNCGIDYLRRTQLTFQDIDELDLSSRASSPEHTATRNQQRERLATAIRHLPLSLRQPIVMRLDGCSYEEIAEALDLTVSNVGVRLHRGKVELKELIHD